MTATQKIFVKNLIQDYYIFALFKRAKSDKQKFYKQILILAKKH
jgi:hypothetical protein